MKKLSRKLREFYIHKNRKRYKKLYRVSKSISHKKKIKGAIGKKTPGKKKLYLRAKRNTIKKQLFKEFTYSNEEPTVVEVNQEFGLESSQNIDYFLEKACEAIGFDTQQLFIDIRKCSRVWPSAITLLCSLVQWIEQWMETTHPKKRGAAPQIGSSDSSQQSVNAYLQHCGFYDYVGRQSIYHGESCNEANTIKIRREKSQKNVEEREMEICELLMQNGNYNEEDIELFDSIVLTEVFANVQEHGVSLQDEGWWLMAQYHPTHQIISLNIADNGVGLKNTLITGPQCGYFEGRNISFSDRNDGEFIEIAMEENVSGAYDARLKTPGFIRDSYERGARRGNGLKRIIKTCKDLGIKFSILSHYGYAFMDENGKLAKCGSKENRIFAGTLYHFNIPERGVA